MINYTISFIRLAMYLLMGYLVGLWLAAPGIFSWTVATTAWGNLMVYIYLLLWPIILIWTFVVWSLLFCVVIFVICVVYAYFFDKLT
jgi:hypothetical protein